MGKINIEIPEELHKKMKLYCVMHDLTIAEFVIKALEEKVKDIKI